MNSIYMSTNYCKWETPWWSLPPSDWTPKAQPKSSTTWAKQTHNSSHKAFSHSSWLKGIAWKDCGCVNFFIWKPFNLFPKKRLNWMAWNVLNGGKDCGCVNFFHLEKRLNGLKCPKQRTARQGQMMTANRCQESASRCCHRTSRCSRETPLHAPRPSWQTSQWAQRCPPPS